MANNPNNRKNLIPFTGADDPRRVNGIPPIVSDIKAFIREGLNEETSKGSGTTKLEALRAKLFKMANEGNLKALELAMAYGYGKPTQQIDFNSIGSNSIPIIDWTKTKTTEEGDIK